uniref:Putative 7 protein n=1 Tax=Infectious bronchitis virus TaxID=11120 RepID=A0A7D5AW83_9GAMC|nr:putative 7 protein [Infectious bronchitis virus]
MNISLLFVPFVDYAAFYFLKFLSLITGYDCGFLLYTRVFYLIFSICVFSVVLVCTLLFSLYYLRRSLFSAKADRHVV